MRLDEIKTEGRIGPETALHAYEETGIKPAHNWAQCGIAVVAEACGVGNSEVFEAIGKPYKAGYIDGFDEGTKRGWRRVILGWLRAGNVGRYRMGFEDGVTLRRALRAGLKAEDLDATALDEELAQLRADELASA